MNYFQVPETRYTDKPVIGQSFRLSQIHQEKPMLPNIPGLGQLQKQMQKMQEDMARLQVELENERLETSSGGGMVKIATNGKGEVLDVVLSPEVVDPNDIEMLQDLIVSGLRDALKKAEDHRTAKMNDVTGGVLGKLPPGLF